MALKVASVPHEPYLMDDGSGGYKGYIVDLLSELAAVTQQEHEIVVPADGRYGRFDASSGKFDGKIRLNVTRIHT